MPRQEEELQMDSGARIDTYNDDDEMDNYDDEDNEGRGGRRGFGDLADGDKLAVDLDDIQDNDSEDEAIDLSKGAAAMAKNSSATGRNSEETKYESNTSGSDDQNNSTGGSSGSAGALSSGNLFAVGESTDKGLADMETGSEVYMSELLVSRIIRTG